jgi:hypothetical protein
MDPLKKIPEAAEWLGISVDLLREWVAGGTVPFTTLASRTADGRPSTRIVRFTDEHLAAIVAMGEQWPPDQRLRSVVRGTGSGPGTDGGTP